MPTVAGGVALIALSTLTALSASGREPAPGWRDPLAVEAQLGVGTPLGFAGGWPST